MLISPNYKDTDFTRPFDINAKITIFFDRTRGWQLDIADQIINGREGLEPMKHAGFAVLSIVLSYFEMIAEYQDDFAQPYKSEEYFKKGVYSVFPSLKEEHEKSSIQAKIVDHLLDALYDGCRCGLYHSGITNSCIILSRDYNYAIVFDSTQLKLIINPHLLVPHLKNHLEDYVKKLKDVTNNELRQKFEKRFDYDAQT